MVLRNILFLISDASLASEDILIGLPVLKHLEIDSRALLERNCAHLDGMNYSSFPLPSASDKRSSLGRIMIGRLERSETEDMACYDCDISESCEEETKSTSILQAAWPSTAKDTHDLGRPSSNYYVNRFNDNPFPDLNLMDLDGPSKAKHEENDIACMVQRAKKILP